MARDKKKRKLELGLELTPKIESRLELSLEYLDSSKISNYLCGEFDFITDINSVDIEKIGDFFDGIIHNLEYNLYDTREDAKHAVFKFVLTHNYVLPLLGIDFSSKYKYFLKVLHHSPYELSEDPAFFYRGEIDNEPKEVGVVVEEISKETFLGGDNASVSPSITRGFNVRMAEIRSRVFSRPPNFNESDYYTALAIMFPARYSLNLKKLNVSDGTKTWEKLKGFYGRLAIDVPEYFR